MENSNGSGMTGVEAQQQHSSSSLDSSSAGAQEAALQLLQSLLQVTVLQSLRDVCGHLQNPYKACIHVLGWMACNIRPLMGHCSA